MPTGAQAAVRPHHHSINFHSTFPRKQIYFVVILVHFLVYSCSAQFPGDSDVEAKALLKFKSSLTNAEAPLSNWDPATPPCSGERGNWLGVLCYNGYVWGLQLERMNLKGNIDVDALSPLRFMRAVSFMGNTFEGPMPDWKKVGAIKALYLSDNQFSGQIAVDAFRGMYSLKKVHLANNNFTGPLPTSLESPKLIELKLQHNHFTGTIPKISSDSLKELDLSNNQLEGPIPSGLNLMDPLAFAGNKALCGAPLSNACDPTLYPPPSSSSSSSSSPPPSLSSSKTPVALIIILILVGILLLLLVIFLLARFRKRGIDETPQLGKPITAAVDIEKAPPAPATVAEADTGGILAGGKKSDQHQPGKLSFVDERRHKFDLQDLMRASAEVLGSGNFGASYKAVLVDGEALVVKRFKQMNGIAREDFHEHMRRLGRLNHPNLLPLVAYLFRKEEKLLVFDFVNNGSLAALLHGKHSGVLNWVTRLKIIKGVAKGLVYLQNEVPTMTVPHGHLKSSNVLLDNEYNPLLMDYALHPVVNSTYVHNVLLAYKSPEYAQHGRISKKTDVWCLGTLILEILTGRYLSHATTTDLAAWINGIAGEEYSKVFDKDMEAGAVGSRNQMEKMLQIGISCCKEDADKRWDLEVAARQIDLVQLDD
ncbi:non-specific serine/threonine protein kinase [Salvia divinorum]|uniref:Non-specific serine/threonine protein kinase n=1 Tax=Salvia divinorum TaxID=28513 RepID=A0ABD1H614_SALDI